MSFNEIYAGPLRRGAEPGRRLIINTFYALAVASVLGAAALLALSYNLPKRSSSSSGSAAPASISPTTPGETTAPAAPAVDAKEWMIRGALSETCTCAVPCTCNFGEGPSPHSYCYPFYSYDIREGHYGDIKLDGLHFGAADLRSGRTTFIDERADARQRGALRIIATRVIEHASIQEAEAKAREIAPRIRYVAVKQDYDDQHNHLEVAGIGQFSANYIMGLDKSQPLVVRNNTTWRIRDAIKAKTTIYRVRVGRDVVNTKDTNSNQGEFDYNSQMDFGAAAEWNCGACANHAAHSSSSSEQSEQMCQP